jgi:hypothetical protein
MKTLADFKKVLKQEGVQLETLSLVAGSQGGRLRVGMIRFVNIYNTVGVYLKENPEDKGSGSFLDWGKASEWVFDGDVATNTKYGYSYRVIEPQREAA